MTQLTTGNSAIFVQDGGAQPFIKPKSAGVEGQMIALDGITLAQGDVAPVFAFDPRRYKAYVPVATQVSPPGDFDTFNLMLREDVGSIPKILTRPTCPQTFYKNNGTCADPTNFLRGWDSYVMVIPDTVASGNITAAGTSFTSDDINEDSQARKALSPMFPIGSLFFGADSLAARAVVSVTYGRRSTDCIVCSGTPEVNDIYALVGGTGVIAASVRYSTDGGNSWANMAITGIGATELPVKILATPDYLIVVSPTAGGAVVSGYFLSAIDSRTGVPSSTWTEVTAGFIATGTATDATLDAANTLHIAGALGYIYKSDNLTAGVTVARQGGVGLDGVLSIAAASNDTGVLVASTNGGDVMITVNNGTIWGFTTAAPDVSGGLVGAVDKLTIFATNSSGVLSVTTNGGVTWDVVTLPVPATYVSAIAVVNRNVIYILNDYADGMLLSSWDGGYSWATTDPRLYNVPALTSRRALAVPFRGSDGVRANHLLIAGANVATLGVIGYAAANVK